MVKFVGICVVVLVLAAGFIVVSQADDIAALFAAFRAEPLTQKFAWFVIGLAVLALVFSAQHELAARQLPGFPFLLAGRQPVRQIYGQ
jgi:hypothetical protein